MRLIILSIFTMLLFVTCYANKLDQENPLDRKIPDDIYFFNPQIKTSNTLEFSNHKNANILLQKAIDQLEGDGGGVLLIKKGTYVIEEVHLKSNVHIRVEPGTVFKTKTPKNAVFRIGYANAYKEVQNWSFKSTESLPFSFDFTNLNPNDKIRAFQLGNTKNFKLGDFKVIDNNTKFNAIGLSVVGGNPGKFPSFGIIENIDVYNAHYGYGLVQAQVGQDVLFRNLHSTGGVTLRLESGYKGVADRYLTDKTITLHNIWGRNISCTNGAHAVMVSPHTLHQGIIDVRDVKSKSCQAAVAIGFGFLSKKKNQIATGHVPGTFSEKSVIANIHAEYGTNAQVRAARLKFVPCSLRKYISTERNPDNESYKAPSIAAIYYISLDGYKSFNKPAGTYKMVVKNVTHSGFSTEVPVNGIITSSAYNDFEKCQKSGPPIFIKRKERNTLNPLQTSYK